MSNDTVTETDTVTVTVADKNPEEIKSITKKVSDMESESTVSESSKTNGTLNNNLPASDIESKEEVVQKSEKTTESAEPESSLEQSNSAEIVGKSSNGDVDTTKKSEATTEKPPAESSLESIELKKEESEESKGANKHTLPKWMVEDANAPLSESEIAAEKEKEAAAAAKAEATKKAGGRGRGRGRPAAKVTSGADKEQAQSGAGSSSQATERDLSPPAGLQRPRRSTRAKVDYANPDAATVIAEVDDEEPGDLNTLRKGARGGARGAKTTGRGRKRKVTETSEEAEIDDDAGSDYGAKSKKKKTTAVSKPIKAGGAAGRGRGRPPAGTSSAKGKRGGRRGRPAGGARTAKTKAHESEDDDAEVVYDDHESDKEQTPEVEEDSDREQELSSKVTTVTKPPLKKRGRPSASAHPPSKPVSKNAVVEKPGEDEEQIESKSKEESAADPVEAEAAEKPAGGVEMEA